MTLPRTIVATASTPRVYKHVIDSGARTNKNNSHHQYSPQHNGFLSHKKGSKKTHRGTNSTSRTGTSGPKNKRANSARAKQGVDSGNNHTADNAPHPLVLERRKPQDFGNQVEQHIREFQGLARNLLELREQEHQEISRELHDNIAQVLSAVTNRLTLARQESIPAWLRQELEDLRTDLQSALADVRTLARDLRPSVFDHLGFAAALEKHAEAFRERTRMTLDLAFAPDAVSFLDHGDLTHLFRLTQEALQNIEEHSGAENAWINLWQRDGTMLLEIGDDGCAFTPDRVIEAQKDGHLGLLGMRERAELLGGEFVLEAIPGEGTVIVVTIPPPPPQNPRRKRP